MIGSKILAKAYRLTNKVETTFLDGLTATSYEELNDVYGKRVVDILRAGVDKNALMQSAYTDLISTVGLSEGDNGYNGEYAFPSNLVMPVRVEVSFDGVTWIKCDIIDNAINRRSEFNDTQINRNYSQSAPAVDFFHDSYKIRPIKNTAGDITKGIYIEYEKRQSDFSSSTAPTDIESNLQDVLAYDLASQEHIMHASKYKPIEIQVFNAKKQEVEDRFFKFYKTRLPIKKTMTFVHRDYS